MSLFQKSVAEKYLKQVDTKILDSKYTEYKAYFGNSEIQQNIRNSKEEQFQEGFLRELFVNILGYTLNPSPNYNLTTEYKNIKDSKKADGAIINNGLVKAVIELKGTDTTDLGKVESQAFGYKNNQPECVYIITSNFEKIRFYIDNAIEHLEFNLFKLTKGDFDILYLCLAYNQIVNGIPKKIKDESLSQEDLITKKLYQDYSLFKRELHQNLVEQNPQYDALTLFKKSQKLLDRLLFLFFAEDRQLLPPNSVRLVLNDWKDLQERDVEISLYDRFKRYFGYLNTGFKGKRYDVFAYNGGLFKPDEILDCVIIDDNLLLKHTLKLSEYDFVSEVDVNILGHIFENSLNELDEIKAQLEGKAIDKSKSKRKKEGVYYTPKYITKYIVDNTVGKLCMEKKVELQINEEDYISDKKRQTKTKQALLSKLVDYRNWLLKLTICDPACGSGAFLNQTLDFLIREHQYIDELQAKIIGASLILSDIENSILENNLFGVDLNEESVEIAKLSLWLRTAQPNRKLNDLNHNIKCGNSLIDDTETIGEKAFSWKDEFPKVFENGGFDVVLGNPPYGAELNSLTKEFLNNKYISFKGNYDIYSAFLQLAFILVKYQGVWGFINPVSWQSNENFYELRKYFKENGMLQVAIKLPYNVFADAYIDTGIYIAKKLFIKSYESLVYEFPVRTPLSGSSLQFKELRKLSSNYWNHLDSLKIVLNPDYYELLPKLHNNTKPLSIYSESVRGILPNEADISENELPQYKPFFTGNLFRYEIEEKYSWVKYGDNLKEKPRDYNWFKGERIILRRLINRQFRIMGYLLDTEFVNKKDIYIIKNINSSLSSFYLLSIINSKLISFLKTKGSTSATKDDFSQLTLNDIREIPIKYIAEEFQKPFIDRANLMISLNKELQEVNQTFRRTIRRKFIIEDLSSKLLSWHSLSYNGFITELGKKKTKLSLSEEAEWESYFMQESKKALELKAIIETTDKEIDQLVYKLYDLNDEEIKIVEGL
jgi:hypothetical protein